MENVISALRLLSMFDKQIGGEQGYADDDPKPVPNFHDETDLDAEGDRVSGYKPPPPQYQNPEPPVTGSYPKDESPPNPYEGSEGPIHEGLPGTEKTDSQKLIEAMQPKHRFSDRLYGLIDRLPVKDPNPSIKKRLLQGLFAGVTGDIEGSDRAVNGQYYRDLDRWKQELGATQIGVNAEDKEGDNMRLLAFGGLRNQNAEGALEIRRAEHERKVEKDANELKVSQARLELQRAALKNPSYEFIQGQDEYIYGFDRKSNSYHKFDIKGKDLDFETRESIQLKNATILARRRSALQMEEDRAKERAKTSNPELATQRKVELYNRAHEYMSKHTDMAKYVTLGAPGTNDFDIEVPAPEAWFNHGPEKEAYDAMVKFIFDEHGPSTPTTTPTTPTTSGTPNPNVKGAGIGQPPGKVHMISPPDKDGKRKKGWVPTERQQYYEDLGYETISGVE